MPDTNISNFLFELGCEELPSGQIKNIADYFISKLEESLDEAEIKYQASEAFYTPRRITILIKDINLDVQDKEVITKGPPEKIAKDDKGELSQAALGFLKKNNAAHQMVPLRFSPPQGRLRPELQHRPQHERPPPHVHHRTDAVQGRREASGHGDDCKGAIGNDNLIYFFLH